MKIPDTTNRVLPVLLRANNRSDIKFDGRIVAEVSTATARALDKPWRWRELRVYRTVGDNIVCERVGCSTYPGESDRRTVEVLGRDPTEEQVVAFFGLSEIAKELYRLLAIEGDSVVERIA